MSILDQIFQINTGGGPTQVNLTSADWMTVGVAHSAHQAMKDGMLLNDGNEAYQSNLALVNESRRIDNLGRPDYGEGGAINVAKSIDIASDYRRILIEDQLRDVRKTDTVDSVVDSGIKNGSKVIISIVPENDGNVSSWDERVRVVNNDRSVVFPHFSVANITEPNEARYQIHETFGADIIQSFGDRPRIFMISGYILNGKVKVGNQGVSQDWKNAFQRMYKDRFSLTNCVKNKEKIRIMSQDSIWDGYLVNMMSQITAETQSMSQVTISFVLKKETFIEENDKEIPGFVRESGFSTPGRIAFFPEASIEEYFNSDLEAQIEQELDDKRRELVEIRRSIGRLDDNSIEIIANLVVDEENSFFSPSRRFSLHEALRGSAIEREVVDMEEEYQEINNRVMEYNQKWFDLDSEEIINPKDRIGSEPEIGAEWLDKGENPFSEYDSLNIELANIRNRRENIPQRIRSLNNLCEEHVDIYAYIQELEWALNS